MFELHAVDVVMYDVTWCGGISEAKKISDMADTYKIPTSPHTGGGPILWFASIHMATSLTNFYIMESVYHLYNDLYPHFMKNVPVPVNGYVTAPELPGLGIEFVRNPSGTAMLLSRPSQPCERHHVWAVSAVRRR